MLQALHQTPFFFACQLPYYGRGRDCPSQLPSEGSEAREVKSPTQDHTTKKQMNWNLCLLSLPPKPVSCISMDQGLGLFKFEKVLPLSQPHIGFLTPYCVLCMLLFDYLP